MKKLQKEQLVNVSGGTTDRRCDRMNRRVRQALFDENTDRYNILYD